MGKILRKLTTVFSGLAMLISLAAISSVQYAQAGTEDWVAHPPFHIKRNSTSGPIGYNPAEIRMGYGLNQISATGTGQTIAIVDAYGSQTIQGDLAAFCHQFGLPSANLTIAYPEGKPRKNGGWALETSLDVEWAHAIAPGSNILLVVAKTSSLSNLIKAINYASSHGVKVVSNSWGGSEFSGEDSYDSGFQHAGIVYVASSGDNGAGVEWPAASPYVLSVGGTTLNLDSSGNYLSETAWSGSGGGLSGYEAVPSYQGNWINIVDSSRGVPDVAWDADPSTGVAVYDSTPYNGQSGWFELGGSSFGAPSWAAMIALADQGRGTSLTSFEAITRLYNAAGTIGSVGYPTYYHDITQGRNGLYSAQAGYDLVTGIGSPQANKLIPVLTNLL